MTDLPTRLAPVAGVLAAKGLDFISDRWGHKYKGACVDDDAAARIAESILAECLEAKGDLTCGHMDGEKPPYYCTSYASGHPVTFGGETKMDCLISACLATNERD